jgi:transcriptional regulator with XRE-family HTH domain
MGVEQFGARLRELREAAGLTQLGLAQKAGLHREAVGQLERGTRHPAWETVLALAEALGVSVAAFEPEKKKGKGK